MPTVLMFAKPVHPTVYLARVQLNATLVLPNLLFKQAKLYAQQLLVLIITPII